mmetsp:Transcript_154921/g.269745  ORF Transcript_154921/g.269745 Transcript_154921/m.269745 type:complete len:133 (-) Transcript_154921:45-443(-)
MSQGDGLELGITRQDHGQSLALMSAGSLPQMGVSWQARGPSPAWTSAGSIALARRLLQGLGQALRLPWALGQESRPELIVGTLALSPGGKAPPQRLSRHLQLGRHCDLARCSVADLAVARSIAPAPSWGMHL